MTFIDADTFIQELQESKKYTFGHGWQEQIQVLDVLIDIVNEAKTAAKDYDYSLVFEKDESRSPKEMIQAIEQELAAAREELYGS